MVVIQRLSSVDISNIDLSGSLVFSFHILEMVNIIRIHYYIYMVLVMM